MEKKPLWVEALQMFWQHRQELMKWMIVFVVIYSPIEFWLLKQLGPHNAALFALLKSHANDMATQIQALPKPNSFTFLVTFVPYWVASYFTTVLYLRQAPILAAPSASVKGFFYTVIKIIVKYLLITGLMLLMLIPASIVVAIIGSIAGKASGWIIAAVLAMFFAVIAELYLLIRYALVYVLAVEGIKSSLRLSARLMRGNMWRLVGNYLVLLLISLPLVVINLLIPFGWMGPENFWENPAYTAAASIIISIGGVIMLVVFTAFPCCVARIFYQEKKLADASFQLAIKAN